MKSYKRKEQDFSRLNRIMIADSFEEYHRSKWCSVVSGFRPKRKGSSAEIVGNKLRNPQSSSGKEITEYLDSQFKTFILHSYSFMNCCCWKTENTIVLIQERS
ncbi:hypothetical protein Tcan_00799, partial [Toxocara canis]